MQIAALFTTLAISIVGGLLTGLIASRFGKLEQFFDDEEHFHECEPEGKKAEKKEENGPGVDIQMQDTKNAIE